MKKKNSLIIECNQRVDLVQQAQSGVLKLPASNAKLDCGREELHQEPVKVLKRDDGLEEFYTTDMAEVTFQIQCIRREQCNLIRNALDDIAGLALARYRFSRGGSIYRETELLVENMSAILLYGALFDRPEILEFAKCLLEGGLHVSLNNLDAQLLQQVKSDHCNMQQRIRECELHRQIILTGYRKIDPSRAAFIEQQSNESIAAAPCMHPVMASIDNVVATAKLGLGRVSGVSESANTAPPHLG